jgi:dolichol-phosphate mannosyltransferase
MENKMLNSTPNKTLSLGLPCFNEEKNISIVLENSINVLSSYFLDWEIIIVDNKSSDKTLETIYQKIDKYNKFKKKIIVIKNKENIFYSGSVQKIYDLSKFDYLAIMDADNQYNPKDIIKCFQTIKKYNYDLVFGIRTNRSDSKYRKVVSYIYKLINILLIKSYLKDINCGLRVLKKYKKIKFIKGLNHINPEIYASFYFDKKKITETDIEHKERKYGDSANSIIEILKTFIQVIYYLIKIKKKYKI